jgi:hypothetical protein
MRRVLLTILGATAVVVLLLAGTVFFPRSRAWVLWVGRAAPPDPFVTWVSALRAYGWRFDCEAARPARAKDMEGWVFECFPSETQPWGGANPR